MHKATRIFGTLILSGIVIVAAPLLSRADGIDTLGAKDPIAASVFKEPPSADRDQSSRLTQRRGGIWGRWWRGSSQHQKNHEDVKSAYKASTSTVALSVARILADGKPVALATVVDADGYLVTKASLLENGKRLTCEFSDEEPVEVTVAGRDQDYDVALLKIDGQQVTPVTWRRESAETGTFVAAVDVGGDVIGVGVISTDPRRVRGDRDANPRRAFLGVTLGGGSAGTAVTEVTERSAADRAGLKVGDVIKGISGTEMRSMEQIISRIGRSHPGDEIALMVKRGDEVLELSATLGTPPSTGLLPQDQWGGGPFSTRREDFPEVLTHDTIVRPEQCGGPLVDTDGNVVGINIARALRVTTYAVPAAVIQRLVTQLKKV